MRCGNIFASSDQKKVFNPDFFPLKILCNEKLSRNSGNAWIEQVGAHHILKMINVREVSDVLYFLYSLPGEAASPSSRLSSSVV